MLDKIIQHALKEYDGNEVAATQFVEGFIKEAGVWDTLMAAPTSPGRDAKGGQRDETVAMQLRKGFSGALGKGLGDMAIGAGATGVATVYQAVQNANLHNKFLQSLHRAVEQNPVLREAKKERVLQYGETVFRFAPNVATDSNLLASILANAIHGEGIDPMTIKTLTELEGRFSQNTTFSPKQYI